MAGRIESTWTRDWTPDERTAYQMVTQRHNVFSEAELETLVEHGVNCTHPGQVGDGKFRDNRRSEICWLRKADWVWLHDRLWTLVRKVNQEEYNFHIIPGIGGPDSPQLARYDEGNEGHYDWHVDLGPSSWSRKLSVVLQLSDPDAYEGGEFQILCGSKPTNLPRHQGSVFIFPSFMLHRVTPVTKGTRFSVVRWYYGSPWR